jgi:hypothetical protein
MLTAMYAGDIEGAEEVMEAGSVQGTPFFSFYVFD